MAVACLERVYLYSDANLSNWFVLILFNLIVIIKIIEILKTISAWSIWNSGVWWTQRSGSREPQNVPFSKRLTHTNLTTNISAYLNLVASITEKISSHSSHGFDIASIQNICIVYFLWLFDKKSELKAQ